MEQKFKEAEKMFAEQKKDILKRADEKLEIKLQQIIQLEASLETHVKNDFGKSLN